jgi:hypothetical protein
MKMSRNLLLAAFAVYSFSAVASEGEKSIFTKASELVASAGSSIAGAGYTVAHLPLDLVDVLGAESLAKYLGDVKDSEKGFVANNSTAIARTTVALTAAALVVALYQAYQSLMTEEDMEDGDEYFNVFETEENEEEVIADEIQ